MVFNRSEARSQKNRQLSSCTCTRVIEYNNFDLLETSCEKALGVHIDDNLTWKKSFSTRFKKISSYLWLLFQIKSYLYLQHRVLFYNAYIKPHFEYCCVI